MWGNMSFGSVVEISKEKPPPPLLSPHARKCRMIEAGASSPHPEVGSQKHLLTVNLPSRWRDHEKFFFKVTLQANDCE